MQINVFAVWALRLNRKYTKLEANGARDSPTVQTSCFWKSTSRFGSVALGISGWGGETLAAESQGLPECKAVPVCGMPCQAAQHEAQNQQASEIRTRGHWDSIWERGMCIMKKLSEIHCQIRNNFMTI